MSRLMNLMERMGMTDSPSTEEVEEVVVAPESAPSQAAPTSAKPAATPAINSDPEMVEKIMDSVTSATHSPVVARFLNNLEKANTIFPNDNANAVKAAVGFANLKSAEIRDEMSRSVAAAMQEVENGIASDADRKKAEAQDAHNDKTATLSSKIEEDEAALAVIQKRLEENRAAYAALDSDLAAETGEIETKKALALGSLQSVRTQLATIQSLLP